MKISIIIPVYNVEQYIECCLDCVRAQTYTNWEAICVNDGSTDCSLDILQKYAEIDKRFRIISQENGGLSCARNTGMKYSIGEYILFLDSDDCWSGNDFLEKLVSQVTINYPDMILVGQARFHNVNKLPFLPMYTYELDDFNGATTEVFCKLYKKNKFPVSAWSKLIKRSILDGIEFTPNLLGEDMDWIQRVLPRCSTIEGNNDVWYLYRERENSITKTYKRKNAEDFCWILEYWKHFWESSNEDSRYIYLGYLAYLYVTLLYKYCYINLNDRRYLRRRMIILLDLLKYSNTKKTARINIIKCVVGRKLLIPLVGSIRYITDYIKKVL